MTHDDHMKIMGWILVLMGIMCIPFVVILMMPFVAMIMIMLDYLGSVA